MISRRRMRVAEAMREIGVLIVVFGSMSSVFETEYSGVKLLGFVLIWFAFGVVVFFAGLMTEGAD